MGLWRKAKKWKRNAACISYSNFILLIKITFYPLYSPLLPGHMWQPLLPLLYSETWPWQWEPVPLQCLAECLLERWPVALDLLQRQQSCWTSWMLQVLQVQGRYYTCTGRLSSPWDVVPGCPLKTGGEKMEKFNTLKETTLPWQMYW